MPRRVPESLGPGSSEGGLDCNGRSNFGECFAGVSRGSESGNPSTRDGGSDQAFAEGIRLRRAEGCFQDTQAHRLQSRIQLGGVNAVAVVKDEPVRFLTCDCLPELLK